MSTAELKESEYSNLSAAESDAEIGKRKRDEGAEAATSDDNIKKSKSESTEAPQVTTVNILLLFSY